MANGLEGVLGGDPSTPGRSAQMAVSSGDSSVTFTHYLSNTILSDITWTYEWSTDLNEWKSSGETNSTGVKVTIAEDSRIDNEAPDNDLLTVTAGVDANGASTTKFFLRITTRKAPQP